VWLASALTACGAVTGVAPVKGEEFRYLAEQSGRLHRRLEGRTGGPTDRAAVSGPRTAHSAPHLVKPMAASRITALSRITAPSHITEPSHTTEPKIIIVHKASTASGVVNGHLGLAFATSRVPKQSGIQPGRD